MTFKIKFNYKIPFCGVKFRKFVSESQIEDTEY